MIPLWGWTLKNIFLALGDPFFGQAMIKRLHFLEKAQWWSRERVYEQRDRTLKQLIQVAYQEVPFYRELMDERKLKPADIQKASDLEKLPIITKAMMRPNYPHKTLRETGQSVYESKTSGSSGENFSVMEDAFTAGWYRATFFLMLSWAGWNFGERHLQTGMSLDRSFTKQLKDAFLRCHYVSAYDLRDVHLDEMLDLLDQKQIKHVWGYPGSLYYLARRAHQKGWNQPLNSVITWGDNLFPHYRSILEKAFGTKVTDTYGCAEGMHVAGQCGMSAGYHVQSMDVVVEYLNDQDKPVSLQESGNLVVTRLHPGPMPLIRYRIGDLGIQGSQERCPCGRGFDRMQSIEGRDTDVVVTPSGNRLIVHFFTGILEHFSEIESFQIIQEDANSLRFLFVPMRSYNDSVQEKIIDQFYEKGLMGMKIQFEKVKTIPTPVLGKRRFVINKFQENRAKETKS